MEFVTFFPRRQIFTQEEKEKKTKKKLPSEKTN